MELLRGWWVCVCSKECAPSTLILGGEPSSRSIADDDDEEEEEDEAPEVEDDNEEEEEADNEEAEKAADDDDVEEEITSVRKPQLDTTRLVMLRGLNRLWNKTMTTM